MIHVVCKMIQGQRVRPPANQGKKKPPQHATGVHLYKDHQNKKKKEPLSFEMGEGCTATSKNHHD